ncbi:MAG TPA: cytochrome P450 [Actinophytocola sp.]|uniref:cytochrome P450 family protein n=1 Tax=Actinophytocola sp. TaxID=1872138 RepID=UPI002DB81E17|nr:cytochrome P450 [Actinophytocola sp.]HEU5471098.1 cytochrome P450 [Actinophytocola sp.]
MAEPIVLDREFIQDPYSLYRKLREEAPVRQVVTPNGLRSWLVTRFEDAREALADPRLSRDLRLAPDLFARHSTTGRDAAEFGQELAAHMLNSDPPDHTRLRRVVTRAFTMRRVEQLRPRIEQITADLLAGMAGRDEVDLLDAFAFPLPVTVMCELLGVPVEDQGEFRHWTHAMITSGDRDAAMAAIRDSAVYLSALIAGKRDNPADDLLSALVHDEDETLNDVELISMAFLLLIAGHETTVNLIANGMLALLRHPDQLAALRADPGLVPGAVEEFLRYESPINNTPLRHTIAPVTIGGVEIPKGELVLVALGSANRDTTRFPAADHLDITREPTPHLAFGHGIHYCLGAPLARLEGQIAIARLLEAFPALALATDPANLNWRNSNILHGLESLPVRLR